MPEQALTILTEKSADTILEIGGTQSWVLDRVRAKRCRYVVLCQNAHTAWGDRREPHGTAFMVGRIDDVIRSTDTEGRWLVTFSEYALIDKSDAWGGWRKPVRYITLEEMGIDPAELEFRPMPRTAEKPKRPQAHDRGQDLTIAQAKQALAHTLGVPPEAIEITIRG